MTAVVYIGLGSNLGDRMRYLASAVQRIADACGRVTAESSILETKAVDFTDQPDFLNQVIRIETLLDPPLLLESLKRIETELGRNKTFPKGPREIDLDILLYDELALNTETLVIPHPEIPNRDFVMRHLIELDPGLRDPLTGIKYSELLKSR